MTRPEPITIEVLSHAEEVRLDALETTIDRNLTAFIAVGEALYEIRESRLYRADHATFDEYLESRWDITRQRAAQLVAGAQVATIAVNHGLQIENERQARELVGLTEEQIGQVSRFMVAASGSEKPTAAQIKAVADVVREIDASATVEHPDTGEQVEFSALPPAAQAAIIRENVSTATHERMERQKTHIAEASAAEQLTSGKSWSDWCMNYAKEQPGHVLTITMQADEAGNPQALAEIHDRETGERLATGERGGYLKKAVLSLVEEVKG